MDFRERLLDTLTPPCIAAILLAFCLFFSPPLAAANDVFFPDRGLLFPDSLESDVTDIGHVFSNPARIRHRSTSPTLKVENVPSFVGYSQTSISGLYPLPHGALFAGYLYFGNSSLDHTVRDSITHRPVRADSFSHAYHYATVGGVYDIPNTPLRFSANLEWAGQQLDGDQVGGPGFGTGLQWRINSQFWTAFYLHRVITAPWRWSSGHSETLGTRLLVAGGYSTETWHLTVDSDSTLWRGRGEYQIGTHVSVFGDLVSVEWQRIQRAGLGVALHLHPIALHYTRLFFSETTLNADHDIFGVSIRL